MSIDTTKPRRFKGDGTIFQNSKGKWVSRIRKVGFPTKEFTGDSRQEVKTSLDKWKLMMQFGEVFTKDMTVNEYAIKFLFHKELQIKRGTLKDSSYDRLERTYRCHVSDSFIGTMYISKLTHVHIQRLIDSKQNDYSFSSINKIYLIFTSMITFGLENKDFPEKFNPCKNVELPDESRLVVKTKQIEIIPNSYIDTLKKYALERNKFGDLEYRYGPALVFALNTGIRQGELLALSKNNIIEYKGGGKAIRIDSTFSTIQNKDKNATTKTIRVITPPKYKRSNRIIPLNKEAIGCLNYMLRTYEESKFRKDLIISTKNGLPPTSRNIQMTLDRILIKSGLPHYGTHALRHTFATKMLNQTSSHAEIKAVAELLGDDFNTVINTYLHTDEDTKFNLINNVLI